MNTDRPAAMPAKTARKYALAAGILYVLTFVSIPTLSLYSGAHDPNYIAGSGPDTPVLVGAVLEIIVALTGIGTAIALYPVVKRQNQSLALGFVAARTLEASAIFAGVVSLLTLVTLRQAGVGAEGLVTGRMLAAQYDRFFLGQGLMPAVNGVLLGTLLYRSRLVPRVLPTLGLIGAPLLLASVLGIMFGILDRMSPVVAICTLPIALWEFTLGVWLTVKGFTPSPVIAEPPAADTGVPAGSALA